MYVCLCVYLICLCLFVKTSAYVLKFIVEISK